MKTLPMWLACQPWSRKWPICRPKLSMRDTPRPLPEVMVTSRPCNTLSKQHSYQTHRANCLWLSKT